MGFKTELIYGPVYSGPRKTVEGWVHWHDTNRLHGYLDDLPQTEFEYVFYGWPTDRPSPGRNPLA